MKHPTHDTFNKDVASHQMFLNLDQGVYRHIVFQQPEHSYLHRFEIITTPWRLMVTGDMGTWVFSRIEDMFCFFRTASGDINPQYWSEKVLNGQHGGGRACEVYNGDAYRDRILDSIDGYGLDAAKRSKIKKELKRLDFDDEHRILGELNDFECDGFTLSDVWEIDMNVYSYHFLWCCYAVVWAIQKYDMGKKEASA